MSKASAIELAERLYGKLQLLCHLFAGQDNVRFYLAACDNMESELKTSVAESYRSRFNILNKELYEIVPPGNLRLNPEIGGIITNTIAYQRESLLPNSANTFADESIETFVKLKGLYLRLAESMLTQDDIRSKVNRDWQIWGQFGINAEFNQLRKGLTWEYSVVNRLVSESAVVDSPKGNQSDEIVEQLKRIRSAWRCKPKGVTRRNFPDYEKMNSLAKKLGWKISEIDRKLET